MSDVLADELRVSPKLDEIFPIGMKFDCCSSYEECSNKRHCVHPSPKYSEGCTYRSRLESGNVYYGKHKLKPAEGAIMKYKEQVLASGIRIRYGKQASATSNKAIVSVSILYAGQWVFLGLLHVRADVKLSKLNAIVTRRLTEDDEV